MNEFMVFRNTDGGIAVVSEREELLLTPEEIAQTGYEPDNETCDFKKVAQQINRTIVRTPQGGFWYQRGQYE